MKFFRDLFSLLLAIFLGIIINLGYSPLAIAQVNQFPCNQDFYFSQGTDPAPVLLNRIDTATGNFNPIPFGGFTNPGAINFNALAYNVQNGNLYALDLIPTQIAGNTYRYQVYRIEPAGPVNIGSVQVNLPSPATREAFAADFDEAGNLVVLTNSQNPNATGGANLFSFPVPALPGGVVQAVQLPLSGGQRPFIPDLAFNPSDRFFYGLDRDNNNALTRFQFDGTTISGFTATNVPGVGIGPYGASFFDARGNFYAYRNPGTGRFIRISGIPGAPVLTELSANPGPSQRNDGASCAFIPVFEKTVSPSPATAGSIVTYTYTLQNRTTITINNLNFSDTMADGRTYIPGTLNITGLGGAPTPVFGAGNTTLTITGATLPAAPTPPAVITQATITVNVQIPVGATGTLLNQADIDGQIGGTNTTVESSSDSPTTLAFPDPTPLPIVPAVGSIGVAKQAGAPTFVSPGVFDVPFTVRVQNTGPLTLSNVQIAEDLSETFLNNPPNNPPALNATLQVDPAIATTGNVGGGGFVGPPTPPPPANGNFNGNLAGVADTGLLGANTTLAPGDFIEVTYTVRVEPGTNLNYTNTVTATGTDPGGNPVNDVSQNGPEVDPDGDGDPTNNNDPTPIGFPIPVRSIGVAKQAGTPIPVAAGVFDVPFTVRVENTGTLPLTNVQVAEDLSQTFLNNPPNNPPALNATLQVNPAINFTGNTASGVFIGPPSPPPAANINFNGNLVGPADTGLLSAGTTLAPGDFIGITYTVRVEPGTNLAYLNSVVATGTDPGGNTATDISQDGVVVDPDGDGNPGNNNDPTPINFGPDLQLLKRITGVIGPTVFPGGFFNGIENPADATVLALQVAGVNPVGVTTINPAIGNPTVQSGDTIQYRVYFINRGGTTASNVQLCDQIPGGTNYVPNSIQLGNPPPPGALADAAAFINPGIVVAVPPCLGSPGNPTGAVQPPPFNVNPGVAGFLQFETIIP